MKPQQNPRITEPRLGQALDQAQRLSEARPAEGSSAGWHAHAAHVGDLSVLALALRD
jgi:hypothetical protein